MPISRVKKRQSSPLRMAGIGAGLGLVVVALLWFPVIRPAYRRHQARQDTRTLIEALTIFANIEGAFPRGNTAAISRLLRGETVDGQNTQQLDYVESFVLNERGEIVDPWGMPYQIRTEPAPRVYSTGPNKLDEQGDGDDLVSE